MRENTHKLGKYVTTKLQCSTSMEVLSMKATDWQNPNVWCWFFKLSWHISEKVRPASCYRIVWCLMPAFPHQINWRFDLYTGNLTLLKLELCCSEDNWDESASLSKVPKNSFYFPLFFFLLLFHFIFIRFYVGFRIYYIL